MNRKEYPSKATLDSRVERERYKSQPCAWCFMTFDGEESMDMETDSGDIYRFHSDCYREFLEKS